MVSHCSTCAVATSAAMSEIIVEIIVLGIALGMLERIVPFRAGGVGVSAARVVSNVLTRGAAGLGLGGRLRVAALIARDRVANVVVLTVLRTVTGWLVFVVWHRR